MINTLSTYKRPWSFIVLILTAAQLAACGSSPTRTVGIIGKAPMTNRIVTIADALEGSPYHYGGTTPNGFDCSGFVYYVYQKAGINVPRTTAGQFENAEPVGVTKLHPGDLLFFRLNKRKVSHVGIYTGGGTFIHAPSTGKQVAYDSLNNRFWGARLKAAGRFR